LNEQFRRASDWLQNKRHDFMEKIVTNNNNTDDKIVGMHPAA